MNQAEHKERHRVLHAALDEIFADAIANSGLRTTSPIFDLIKWSHQQTLAPNHPHRDTGAQLPAPAAPDLPAIAHIIDAYAEALDAHIWDEQGKKDDPDGYAMDDLRVATARAELAAVRKPRVVINLDGGLIQAIFADAAVRVLVMDYDIEGGDADNVADMPQDDGTKSPAYLTLHEEIDFDPAGTETCFAVAIEHFGPPT